MCCAICPNDGEVIRYSVKIIPPRDVVIFAEDISAYLKRFERRKIFQEDLTRITAKRFSSKCKVVGRHLRGEIEITSTWDARK